MKLHQIELWEVIGQFPNVESFDITKVPKAKFDFFLSALGFEERTVAIPRNLALNGNFNCTEAIYFQYETSTTENAYNEPKLKEYFDKISKKVSKIFCDERGFINSLSDKISKKINIKQEPVKIMFDISVCSSKLILSVIKVLLNLNIQLTIVYTEANRYFPEYSTYIKNPEEFKKNNTVNNEIAVLNSDYSGGNKTNPDLVISFPNFKAQRAKNIISEIDETILLKPDDRLIWIVGDPHMENQERANRKNMMLDINEIPEDAKIYEVSTLFYKKTIEQLEVIYQKYNVKCHINIADLGSKMQTLAIALFCNIRPETSIYYASPKTYDTSNYSEGVKDYWIIEFGIIQELVTKINSIDKMVIE
jgi:hypothetical protein